MIRARSDKTDHLKVDQAKAGVSRSRNREVI